jgi:hypothetical protein
MRLATVQTAILFNLLIVASTKCEGWRERSGGGFGAKDALEPRADELDAHDAFAIGEGFAYVDNTPLRLEVVLGTAGKL